MRSDFIDENSPGNLSERDRPVYEEWLHKDKYIPPPWYSNVYLKTDHWSRVKAEVAVYSKGKCAMTIKHYKLPMNVHHNEYTLWQERMCDVIYLCQDCHERNHEIWSEINCKVDKYLATMILHEIKQLLFTDKVMQAMHLDPDNYYNYVEAVATANEFDKSNKVAKLKDYFENFNAVEAVMSVVKDSAGIDRGKRMKARKMIIEQLYLILHHSVGCSIESCA